MPPEQRQDPGSLAQSPTALSCRAPLPRRRGSEMRRPGPRAGDDGTGASVLCPLHVACGHARVSQGRPGWFLPDGATPSG